MKKRLCLLLALCLLPLSGCSFNENALSAGVTVPEEYREIPADYLIGGVIDPQEGFHTVVTSVHSREELLHASAALLSAGVLTDEELSGLLPDQSVSRAMFIRLLAGASGACQPQAAGVLRGSTWYAPYVQAGYSIGLFPDSGRALSFLPADGFLMGDEGYAPMLEPMTRGDALLCLEQILPLTAQAILPPLADGLFHGEGLLSQADALVCAGYVLEGRPYGRRQEPSPSLEALVGEGRILHAGGYVFTENGRRYSYTNSAEALVNAYMTGNRLLEFDFTQTDDGHLACVHGWQSELSPSITAGVPLSFSHWLDSRIYGIFTPLCLESLADFMREHPDLCVVTDVKSNNIGALAVIAGTCPDLLDRFAVQIYKDEEYAFAASMGFSHIIYTLYNLPAQQKLDTGHWIEFASAHPLLGYTYPKAFLDREGYTREMLKAGIPLFVHTLNDPEEILSACDAGITAVYTDTP